MYRWHALLGKFRFEEERVVFQGETTTILDQPATAIGNAISDQRFSGGMLRGTVRFSKIGEHSACQFIVSYSPATGAFVTAGIGNDAMFVVRTFHGTWTYHAGGGDRTALEENRDYEIAVRVTGSRLALTVDGVDVVVTNLPFVIPHNQVGIWCQDTHEITVSNFEVQAQRPTAFVVMQFTRPYNELYSEVVRPICDEFQITSLRADESYGPGLIIADVAKQITEARLVVAEITPANPNVYYEVGYAHALNKPTILIAEMGTQLPFDVSPFRVLFYENSIDGKRRVEDGLRKHLRALEMAPGLTSQ
jgi:hypothetical protein